MQTQRVETRPKTQTLVCDLESALSLRVVRGTGVVVVGKCILLIAESKFSMATL